MRFFDTKIHFFYRKIVQYEKYKETYILGVYTT